MVPRWPLLPSGALFAGALWVGGRITSLRAMAAEVRPLTHELRLPGHGTPRRVVVLGDSAAAGHGLVDADHALARRVARGLHAADGRPTDVTCVAVSGATTSDALHLQAEAASDAEVVIVSVGVNDAMSPRRRLRDAERTYETLLGRVTADPATRVVVLTSPDLSIAPAMPWPLRPAVGWRCRYLAVRQARLADRFGAAVIALPREVLDPSVFGADGLHPGVEGHRRLAAGVLRTLGVG